MAWLKKYRVVRIVPGYIIAPWGQKIDLRNPNLPVETLDKLHAAGCPYIEEIKVQPKKLEKVVETPPDQLLEKKIEKDSSQASHRHRGHE